MLSCSQVARSIASDEYLTETFIHRLGIRMHLAMCRHCSRYFRQLRALARLFRESGTDVPPSEIESTRDRIVERLSQKP